MDNWQGINEFDAVVQTQSFTLAAKQLKTSVAQVSRRVANLEARLATKLLLRTTRKITVTEAGLTYFKHCQHLVDGLKQAEDALQDLNSLPTGLLKVTAPITYGERFIGPLLNKFMTLHPKLKIELILTNKTLDLVEEQIDIAIRLGHLPDSNLISKRLSQRQLLVCASPEYIKAHGQPYTLSELTQHNCLIGNLPLWHFSEKQKNKSIRINGSLTCNSGYALVDAAIKGLGIVQLPDYYVQQAIESGQLVECLKHYREPQQGIWALYPNNRYQTAKVRLLVDYLSEHFLKSEMEQTTS